MDVEILGGWKDQPFECADRKLQIRAAADPDRMLEQLMEGDNIPSAFRDPYWTKLWPASLSMARFLETRKAMLPTGTRCIELGCGSGIPGLALLALGCEVTFSDYVPEAVHLATWNALQNGLSPQESLVLDWHAPPNLKPFQAIVGSDLLYDATLHRPLLGTIRQLLDREGVCWMADAGRGPAGAFIDQAIVEGFTIDCYDANGNAACAPGLKDFRVFELRFDVAR
ncbi:MAG: methyltransferase domain-containing protein [Pirellulales bacterium]